MIEQYNTDHETPIRLDRFRKCKVLKSFIRSSGNDKAQTNGNKSVKQKANNSANTI
jgi:hypothetical protein